MSFGFSAKELIDAVDCTIKFIIDLKQVPDQIRTLQDDLETSKDQLQRLKAAIEAGKSLDTLAAASFERLHKKLIKVLNDTLEFLKRYHPNDASKSSILSNVGRVRWVVDGKYLKTVKGLQERILEIERRIDREILINL